MRRARARRGLDEYSQIGTSAAEDARIPDARTQRILPARWRRSSSTTASLDHYFLSTQPGRDRRPRHRARIRAGSARACASTRTRRRCRARARCAVSIARRPSATRTSIRRAPRSARRPLRRIRWTGSTKAPACSTVRCPTRRPARAPRARTPIWRFFNPRTTNHRYTDEVDAARRDAERSGDLGARRLRPGFGDHVRAARRLTFAVDAAPATRSVALERAIRTRASASTSAPTRERRRRAATIAFIAERRRRRAVASDAGTPRAWASGSMPTRAVAWSVVVTWQRMHGLTHAQHDVADGERVDVVLVVRLEPVEHDVRAEAVHRQRGHGRVAARRSLRSAQRRAADDQHRIAVGEQRVRARVAGEVGIAAARLRAIEAHEAQRRAEVRRQPRRRGVARVEAAHVAAPDRDVARGVVAARRARCRSGGMPGRVEPQRAVARPTADRARARGSSRCVTKRPSASTTIHSRSPTPSVREPRRRDGAARDRSMPRAPLTG